MRTDVEKRLQKLSAKMKPDFVQVSGKRILAAFKRAGVDATGMYDPKESYRVREPENVQFKSIHEFTNDELLGFVMQKSPKKGPR